ncbi:hypothetical protein ACF06P_05890 [Streptomyces sp. NPDC015684]|uniref:hypothetical protein n=1 Tax=Streptomyces sp. NPDC015684 TaxID=3364963 RepID=UPI0036F9C2E8
MTVAPVPPRLAGVLPFWPAAPVAETDRLVTPLGTTNVCSPGLAKTQVVVVPLVVQLPCAWAVPASVTGANPAQITATAVVSARRR